MASEGTAAEKRANLVASRPLWSNMELCPSESSLTQGQHRAGDSTQDSVRDWLTTVNEVDPKPEQSRQAAESLKRNASSEDDLALGVEASLYGKHGVRTVQEFLRSTRPDLSRWNSVTSALSTQSSPLSVMDVLNLWKDDPEEVLFDLGFGSDEPDLSGRIPARFINHQSHARGINVQVLLEAQKNRLDIENPDVSNRFRQLEVLQQVTTAFSTLVGGPAPSASPHAGAPSPGRDLSAEARERRRRMGMLFRKASRRSLGQTQTFQEQPPASSPSDQPEEPPSSIPDKPATLRRTRLVIQESICLSPLAEEQGTLLDSLEAPAVEARLGLGKEIQAVTSSAALARKRSPGQARESFEMEEIHSFDDGSIAGSYSGTGDNTAQAVMRTNSCQSDSSGFLEEPFIPSLHSLQLSPGPGPEHGLWPRYGPWPGSGTGLGSGPGLESGSVHGIGTEHLKALSGGSIDSQVTVKEASLDRSCPASPPPSSTSLSNPPSPSSPTSLSNPPSPSSPTSLSNPPSPSSPTSLSNPPSPSSPTSLSNPPSPSSPTSLSNLPSPSSPTSLSNLPSPSSPPSPSSSSHFPLFTSPFPNPSSTVFPSSLHFSSSSSAYDISATLLFSPTSAACYSIYPSSPYPSSPASPSCLSASLPGSASPLERPASPVERQDLHVERPVSPLERPDSVLERPVSPFERPNLLFERPNSTLGRPDSSGRTPETPAERDVISDKAMGTAPSLMEDVFSGEDGKFSDCGISCHNNPDLSFRDVRKRDTDHFTLGVAGSREGEEEGESEKGRE
ncbi:proline-rich protein 36 [Osmerus eperlanus]|uniref:proline-rich protein 36 n=1 Tax=Osmerus eperlanus TaxID=29151 RepID=UPI002E12641C